MNKGGLVDVIRQYSKNRGLLDDLARTIAQTEQAAKIQDQRRSVRTTARTNERRTLQDRLNADDLRRLIVAYHSGTTQRELAERYGISVTSVKRLLRLHRAAKWIVGQNAPTRTRD